MSDKILLRKFMKIVILMLTAILAKQYGESSRAVSLSQEAQKTIEEIHGEL